MPYNDQQAIIRDTEAFAEAWNKSELAVWQGGLLIKPPGSLLKGHVVQVMKKVNGRWLILEGHPKFFPPAPPR